MICNICKQEITDVAYVELGASIVKQDIANLEPIVFQSPAIRSFYNAKINMHDRCFIKLVGTKTDLKIEGGLGIISVSQ